MTAAASWVDPGLPVLSGRPQRLQIVHSTGFRYRGPVVTSYNEARMTPLTTPQQTTLEARLEVSPTASTYRYWDYWGTQVTAFDVRPAHDSLTVTAHSVVETFPTDGPAATGATDDPGATWEELTTPQTRDRFAELLAPTPRSEPGEEAQAQAGELVAGMTPAQAGRAVVEWVSGAVEYAKGATGVHTSAAEAWEVRQGVCQDMAHIAVGVLRRLGIPARYVSGYLCPRPDLPVGERIAGQSHAWVEWWAGAWQPWDPTSGRPAGADHVVVGRGRDYDDVPPLRGIYCGPGGGELFVSVEFVRLA